MNLAQMTVDAKTQHWMSGTVDVDAATGIQQPYLIDPTRRLAISKALYEVVTTVTTTLTVSIGNTTDTQAYGVVNPAAGNIGDFLEFTLNQAAEDIPESTGIGASHEDAGTIIPGGNGIVHVFYYRKDASPLFVNKV